MRNLAIVFALVVAGCTSSSSPSFDAGHDGGLVTDANALLPASPKIDLTTVGKRAIPEHPMSKGDAGPLKLESAGPYASGVFTSSLPVGKPFVSANPDATRAPWEVVNVNASPDNTIGIGWNASGNDAAHAMSELYFEEDYTPFGAIHQAESYFQFNTVDRAHNYRPWVVAYQYQANLGSGIVSNSFGYGPNDFIDFESALGVQYVKIDNQAVIMAPHNYPLWFLTPVGSNITSLSSPSDTGLFKVADSNGEVINMGKMIGTAGATALYADSAGGGANADNTSFFIGTNNNAAPITTTLNAWSVSGPGVVQMAANGVVNATFKASGASLGSSSNISLQTDSLGANIGQVGDAQWRFAPIVGLEASYAGAYAAGNVSAPGGANYTIAASTTNTLIQGSNLGQLQGGTALLQVQTNGTVLAQSGATTSLGPITLGSVNTQLQTIERWMQACRTTTAGQTCVLTIPVPTDHNGDYDIRVKGRVVTAGGTAAVGDRFIYRSLASAKNVAGTVTDVLIGTPLLLSTDTSQAGNTVAVSSPGTSVVITATQVGVTNTGTIDWQISSEDELN